MLDFEKLDRLFEVQYDENKVCRFAYVWKKSKEGMELDSCSSIKLSDVYKKVKKNGWHFYPGDENTTNGIKDTSLTEINQTRHNVNFMLGLWSQKDLVQGVDYNTEKDFTDTVKALRLFKELALNLLYKEFPSKFAELKVDLLKLL